MSEKMFPVMSYSRQELASGKKPHPTRIPWSVADLAYSVYSGKYGRGQSLARLAERGGFHASEMDDYVPDWRERCSSIIHLRDTCIRLRDRLQAFVGAVADITDCSDDVDALNAADEAIAAATGQ